MYGRIIGIKKNWNQQEIAGYPPFPIGALNPTSLGGVSSVETNKRLLDTPLFL